MNTKNIKNDFITWIGGVFLIADLFYWIAPMFLNKDIEVSYMIMLVGAVIGLGLMLAPKDLYGILKDKINK